MSPSSLSESFSAAREVCRRHARSFFFASHLLNEEKRAAAYSIYAFCRSLDDAVDVEAGEPSQRLARFARLLDAAYAGSVRYDGDDEIARSMLAFSHTVRRYDVPKSLFEDLAEGCRMDGTKLRYLNWEELERYCYHVAGVVGLIMSRVFGPVSNSAEQDAVHMGNAMQLTNILRDVAEDWSRGRVYLPESDMRRFGVSEFDIRSGRMNERFRELMRFEIERARELYRLGARSLWELADDGSRMCASAMAVIYAGILRAIESQDHDVLSGRAAVGTIGKVWRLRNAARLAGRLPGEPIPDVF
jgi:phytoene synthase